MVFGYQITMIFCLLRDLTVYLHGEYLGRKGQSSKRVMEERGNVK